MAAPWRRFYEDTLAPSRDLAEPQQTDEQTQEPAEQEEEEEEP